ncbi:MAG: hypothetical protein QM773_18350 [Hyphomonadaceae bacterium]
MARGAQAGKRALAAPARAKWRGLGREGERREEHTAVAGAEQGCMREFEFLKEERPGHDPEEQQSVHDQRKQGSTKGDLCRCAIGDRIGDADFLRS